MTTKRLVLDLVAFAIVMTFLLFFIPLSLNATNTIINVLGVTVIVAIIIAFIAVVHKKFTQPRENKDEA